MERGLVVWFTGIPASGKSTLAYRIKKMFRDYNYKIIVLESDELRKIITPKPKYSEEERDIFYRSLVAMALLFYNEGYVVLLDATAHKKMYREYARKLNENYMEVYVYCPIEKAMERDPKGLYKKALMGEIKTLPGLQVEYEEPENPDIIVDTSKLGVDESAEIVFNKIMEKINP